MMMGVCAAQPKPAGDEATIKALEEKWDAASLKSDVATLDRLFADKFITTDADGKVKTRAEVLARMKAGDVTYQSAKGDDYKIFVSGDTAIANGHWHGKFTEKGKAIEANERFTDTWIRQNGQWRCLASHSSSLK